MPTIHVSVVTSLSRQEAIRRLSDFGPNRAETWPNVDADGVKVHDQGPNWADVTEGNRFAWERERYGWDTEAGTVSSVTTDSNVWQSGPAWSYRLIPRTGGNPCRSDGSPGRQGHQRKDHRSGAVDHRRENDQVQHCFGPQALSCCSQRLTRKIMSSFRPGLVRPSVLLVVIHRIPSGSCCHAANSAVLIGEVGLGFARGCAFERHGEGECP